MKEKLIQKAERKIQRKLILKNIRDREILITEEEARFFKKYPEELDDMTSTLKAKRLYLSIAAFIGLILVATSIFFRIHPLLGEGVFHHIFIDLTFEGGVALWGAAIVVYLLEVVLENQNNINSAYRQAILKKNTGDGGKGLMKLIC